MAGQLGRKELYRLARMGAEARLSELDRERVDILRSFPDLARTKSGKLAGSGEAPGFRRRRRTMSAAGRKAVSRRMKKYWAARRKQNAKTT